MKQFDDIVKFHRHSCPQLALGYRVALAAMKENIQKQIWQDCMHPVFFRK